MNEIELMLLKHEAFVHRAKLLNMRGMIVLSPEGKAFLNAEIAELTEQIETMSKELHEKKAQRLGWTRLRKHLHVLVLSIVSAGDRFRKGVSR